jgi:acyl-CoA thioester hydrolase
MPTTNHNWDYPNPFLLPLTPSLEDIDGLNHTNNAVYVQWCEKIAWLHSGSLGMDLEAYQRLNRAMAIRQANYDYLLPSNLGDPLLLATWLTASDGKLSLERSFQLIRQSDGATLLRARWHLVCIDLDSGRPRRLPEAFCAAYFPALVDAGDKARNNAA